MMKMSLGIVAALFTFNLVGNACAALINGGFESTTPVGEGWTAGGNVFFSPFVVGSPAPPDSVMPAEGSRFVQLNNGFPGGSDTLGTPTAADIGLALGIPGLPGVEGSYIFQDISLTAGDEISFEYNFLTTEGPTSNAIDFAFVSLSTGSGYTRWQFADITSAIYSSTIGGYPFMTANQSFSILSPYSGSVRLGFAVLDDFDAIWQSSLYLDNVAVDPIPEPATMILFGTGLAGLVGTRLRRKK